MAQVGFLTKISINDGASQAYQVVSECTEATLPGRSTGAVESTLLYQTVSGSPVFGKKYIPSRLIDPGMLKFKVQYDSAIWQRLNGLIGVDHQTPTVLTAFKLEPPDPTVTTPLAFTCAGFVTDVGEITTGREGIMEFECTVRLSGEWTLTGGT